MTFYWLLFAYFALGALASARGSAATTRVPLLIGFIAITVMIGLRYDVGADWITYQLMYEYVGRLSFASALADSDPAYQAVSWVAQSYGLEIWSVNLVCGAIFAFGLFRFIRSQPLPWVGACVAIPYLVIVVAMGYTRQAAALGILMAGLADFSRRESPIRFAVYTIIAAMFHASAAVAYLLVAMVTKRNRWVNLLIVASVGYFLYGIFVAPKVEVLAQGYLQTRYRSEGAAIRIAMNALAAVVFLLIARKAAISTVQRDLWRNFSIAALLMPIALVLSPSSTAIDRISLYLIPLQIAAYSLFASTDREGRGSTALVVLYSAAVLFVWLFFAVHAQFWLPYRFYPF